nr:transposase [Streptomyces sp. NBC_01001]
MAGSNDVSAPTVRRWVQEVIKLLAARAPRLDRARKKIARSGGVAALLDGTLVHTRCRSAKDNRKNHSDKSKAHGLLFLALTDDKGNLIWISAAKPDRTSEITAADKIIGHLWEAGLGALADLGFVGLDDEPEDIPVITTGRKATRNHQLTEAEKEANHLLSRERAAVEHCFANLKTWQIAPKLRMDARHATTLLRALLVLANTEVQRRQTIRRQRSPPRPARAPHRNITPSPLTSGKHDGNTSLWHGGSGRVPRARPRLLCRIYGSETDRASAEAGGAGGSSHTSQECGAPILLAQSAGPTDGTPLYLVYPSGGSASTPRKPLLPPPLQPATSRYP